MNAGASASGYGKAEVGDELELGVDSEGAGRVAART
jgi:hypothetical protein